MKEGVGHKLGHHTGYKISLITVMTGFNFIIKI